MDVVPEPVVVKVPAVVEPAAAAQGLVALHGEHPAGCVVDCSELFHLPLPSQNVFPRSVSVVPLLIVGGSVMVRVPEEVPPGPLRRRPPR